MADIPHDLHEGSWLYVSAGVEPLDGVLAACRSHGWPVIVGSDDLDSQRRAQALRLADACILDVSASWPDAGEALSMALDERRPVIALRRSDALAPPFDDPDVREVSFRDRDECVRRLNRVLTDPAWQRHVACATPSEQHDGKPDALDDRPLEPSARAVPPAPSRAGDRGDRGRALVAAVAPCPVVRPRAARGRASAGGPALRVLGRGARRAPRGPRPL